MYSIYNEETFDSQLNIDLGWNFQTAQVMGGGVGGYIQQIHELLLYMVYYTWRYS